MPRRVIVESDACFFCIAKRCDAPIDHRHARFYVAAMHVVTHGDKANEQLCAKHAEVLDEAVAFNLGNGFAFPDRIPRFKPTPTSTRVDVAPGASQKTASAPGSTSRRRR